MTAPQIIGILLIVFAVVAFAYQDITYTKRGKVLDIGPIRATADTIPPLVAGAALLGGIALIVVGNRR